MLDIVTDPPYIDPRAIVPCPMKDFKPRRATACASCEHYRGLGRMADHGDFSNRYAIRCAHVIERRTHILEVVEE